MKKITPPAKFILFALTAFASVILTQCRKTDMSSDSRDFSATKVISPIIERFFNTDGISEPVVERIVGNILLQEKRKPFVASFVRYAGYPVWSKAIVMNSRELYQNTFTQRGKEDYEQFVLIPLISAVDSSVQSVLQVRCTPEDTNFKMLYRWQYNQNGYGPDAITNNADKMALLFMEFERVVNGHDAFNILDSGLFRQKGKSPQKIKIGSPANPRAANQKMLSIEVCYQTLVWVPDSHGQLVGCPPGEPCNTGHYDVVTEDCRSFSWWINDWPGGGGVGSDVGESPGSGSGTGSTNWDEDPCSSGGSNGPMMRPVPPRGGCGDPPAWEPVPDLPGVPAIKGGVIEPPFVWSYDVTNDNEEQVVDNYPNNKPTFQFLPEDNYEILYPEFTKLVKNLKSFVMSNRKVMSAIKKWSGFSEQVIIDHLGFGEGPIIKVGGASGSLGYFRASENPAILNIRKYYADALEVAPLSFHKEALSFLLAVTVLHEYVHLGAHANGMSEGAYDFGENFEREAFNLVVNTDNVGKVFIDFREYFK